MKNKKGGSVCGEVCNKQVVLKGNKGNKEVVG